MGLDWIVSVDRTFTFVSYTAICLHSHLQTIDCIIIIIIIYSADMICYSAVVIVIFRHYVWPPCFQLIQLIIGVLMQCIIVIIVDNIIKLFSVLFWVLRVQTVDWVFKISIYSWRGFWPVKTCCSRLHLGDLSLAIVTRKSDQIKKQN